MDDTAAATLFAWLDREVWLVTARAGGRAGGLIATFVTPASITPDLPRLLVGLAKSHHTHGLVEESSAFALHLLGEQHLDWVWRFGLASGHDHDKFDGLTFRSGTTGSPLLDDAVGWLDCRVESRMDTGDRTVYLAEVVEGRVTNFARPLTVKHLMRSAPALRLAELKRQRDCDGVADAEAIRAWRQARNGGPPVAGGPS
jgi:flavin reductase (DIM6/NTAB) family NADH-FMN oxidoreductase RutF